MPTAVALRVALALCISAAEPSAPPPARELSAAPYGHPTPNKQYPQRDGYTLMLVEEFEEPLDLETDPIWTWSDGGLSEGQVRFVKEALKFKNGKLIIEAAEEPPRIVPQACSHAEGGFVTPKRYTSGEIRSRHNMFRYGLYEVSMKAPSVQPGNTVVDGNYIATMFAYRAAKFRHWREIDIEVTGDAVNAVTMNVLNADNTANWSPQIASVKQYRPQGVNVREEFHTFAFSWLPGGITWYLDGREIATHRPGRDSLPIPNLSTKIMMNLWIFNTLYDFGGKFGANNRFPMHTEYDWFRFYKWNGDGDYPCHDMTDSCLTDDDRFLSSNNPCDGITQVGDRLHQPCLAACIREPQSATAAAAGHDSVNETEANAETPSLFP